MRGAGCVAVIATACVAGSWGCESSSNTLSKPIRSTTAAPPFQPPAPEPEPASDISALAALTQRDVDTILKARQSTPLPEPVELPRPQIVWNDRPAPGPALVIAAPADSASEAHQLPLGRIAEQAALASAEPAATQPAAQPQLSAAAAPDRVNQLMVDLSRELYAGAAYSDSPMRQLMTIAAMSMVDEDRRLDPLAIPDLTATERQMLGRLQDFFGDLAISAAKPAELEASVSSAAAKLHESLVKQPQLGLPTIALCTRVGGFGDYSPFDRMSFLGGAEQKVIVYLEIDQFTSELNPQGEYVTELAQELTIYSDRDGIPVWKEDWQSAIDVSKNKRQDFFTVQVVTLPKALSVGRYQLKVRVRDEKSSAEAEGSVTFEMVADPRMATR